MKHESYELRREIASIQRENAAISEYLLAIRCDFGLMDGEISMDEADDEEVVEKAGDDDDDLEALLASVDSLVSRSASASATKTRATKFASPADAVTYETDFLTRIKGKLRYHLEEPPFNGECISAAAHRLEELLGRPTPSTDALSKSGLLEYMQKGICIHT